MTIKHFQVFRAVCDCGSITLGAARLNMSQPSASLAIKEMEAYYQVKLFNRANRRIYLTPAGEKLLSYTDAILQNYQSAALDLRDENTYTYCNISVNSDAADTVYPIMQNTASKKLIHVDLKTTIRNSNHVIKRIHANRDDFGIADRPANTKGMTVLDLFSEEMVAVCSNDYLDRDELSPEEILTHPLILREIGSGSRACIDNEFKKHGYELPVSIDSGSTYSCIRLAMLKEGITFIPKSMAEEAQKMLNLRILHITGFDFVRHYCIIYKEKKFLTATMKKICENLLETFRTC